MEKARALAEQLQLQSFVVVVVVVLVAGIGWLVLVGVLYSESALTTPS